MSLISTQKSLVSPLRVMPHLHQRAHLACQVDTVAFKIHCFLRLLSFLLWQPAWHLLPQSNLGRREGVSNLVLALPTSFLPRSVASSATWSYHLVQADNHNSLCCFQGLWIFSEQQLYEGIPYLVLRFLFEHSWLLGLALFTCVVYLCSHASKTTK